MGRVDSALSVPASGRLDHIFVKGFDTPDENGAGTVTNVRGASDHLPVWAIAILPY